MLFDIAQVPDCFAIADDVHCTRGFYDSSKIRVGSTRLLLRVFSRTQTFRRRDLL